MRSGEFISHMEVFFRKRDERVLGKETRARAEDRFAKAIDALLRLPAGQHRRSSRTGRSSPFYLATTAARSPFELWREMGLPSFAVLNLPEMQLDSVVRRIGGS
jgi:hypothetical protein